ncbi:hypothetical protein E2C01_021466 [Portunus trituberculatus]|uniref:Uncharacterized protein n=1 Tax=Portunus trituberculatus TaxID=210409 RepID=A0A5B7E506_PORTR|nr:hypothetical protein [Portunus trituberculatus]
MRPIRCEPRSTSRQPLALVQSSTARKMEAQFHQPIAISIDRSTTSVFGSPVGQIANQSTNLFNRAGDLVHARHTASHVLAHLEPQHHARLLHDVICRGVSVALHLR